MALRPVLGSAAMTSRDPKLPVIVIERREDGISASGVIVDGRRLPGTVDVGVQYPLNAPVVVTVTFLGHVSFVDGIYDPDAGDGESWGICPNRADGLPHETSTTLCVFCMEYDP